MSTTDAERSMLLDYLQAQRRHVLGILEGLDEEALRRPALPSGWTPVGLVNHLSVDVERFWFRAVVAGEAEAVEGVLSATSDGWQVDDAIPAAEVLATYRREIELADAIVAAHVGRGEAGMVVGGSVRGLACGERAGDPPARDRGDRLPRRASRCRPRAPRRQAVARPSLSHTIRSRAVVRAAASPPLRCHGDRA